MLALFPAFYGPEELRRGLARLGLGHPRPEAP
jgi:hypothetical protein